MPFVLLRRRPLRPNRRGLAASSVLVLALTLVTPLLSSPSAAEAAGLLPKPTFTSQEFDLADRPAPVAFLGAGEGGLSYVTESSVGTAVNAYGFDPTTAEPTLLAGLSDYPASDPLGAEVLDLDVAEIDNGSHGRSTQTVAISREDPSSPWVAQYDIAMHTGFDRTVASWTFGAVDAAATDTMVPGAPVGVVLLQHLNSLVVFATTAGVFVYAVDAPPLGWSQRLWDVNGVGEGTLNAAPVAIEHDRGEDLPGLVVPQDPDDGYTFVVVTGDQTGSGGSLAGQLVDVLVLDAMEPYGDGGSKPGMAVRSAYTWTGATDEAIFYDGAVDGLEVAYSAIDQDATDGGARDYHVAVQGGGGWKRYTGSTASPELVPAGGGGCPPISGPSRHAFDYTAVSLASGTGFQGSAGLGSTPLEAAVCVGTDDGGIRLAGRQQGPATPTEVVDRYLYPRDLTDGAFTDPQVLLTLPCAELLRINEITSFGEAEATCDAEDDRFFGVSLLAGRSPTQDVPRTQVDTTSLMGAMPFVEPEPDALWDQFWTLDLTSRTGVVRNLTRLPNTPVVLRVRLPDTTCVGPDTSSCSPRITVGDPVPFALLAAPPQVEGAGQEPLDPPLFARSTAVGDATTTVAAARVGASIGVDYEDPSGLFGAEVEVSYEREVEGESASTNTTTQSQAFGGLVDQDVVVYNATTMWTLDADVVASSTGLGIGTATEVRHPRSNVMTSSSFDFLVDTFPDTFGELTPLGTGMREAFDHDIGNPGTYRSYHADGQSDGAAVDEYCEGSIDGSEPIEVKTASVAPNPFVDDPAPVPPDNAILVSDPFVVLAGTSNAEGASVEIESGSEQSYLQTHSIDVSVQGKVAYATAGVSAGGTWGGGWSYSVSEGTAFEGSVGHIPFAELQDETYEWRMFLCKRDVGSRPGLEGKLPVWILNYTVDEYVGSGGLSLGPVELVSPVAAEVVDPATDLTWHQAEGTIQRFDWELEAIGTPDVRSGAVTYDDMEAGRDPGDVTVALDTPLLPDQLYRWQVRGTDFFGNTVESAHEFFQTAGAPEAGFTFTPGTPTVGEAVTLTATEPTADGTSFAWDVDGTPRTGRVVTHTFTSPGLRDVTLDVTTAQGTASATDQVPVRAHATDDAFAVDEDGFLDVPAPGVLANDDGADGSSLVGDTLHGEVRLAAHGGFTYRPDADWCGTDSFGYEASGGGLDTGETALVVLETTCVNDAPVAADDPGWEAVEDTALVVGAPGVLANDSDVDSATLTAAVLTPPDHGAVSLAPDGSWTYVPELDACGQDRFTYEASDGALPSAPASVTIDVACVNDPPVPPGEITVQGIEDTEVVVDPPTVEDPDDDEHDVTLVGEAEHGTVVQQPDGTFAFMPDPDFCGTASFRYRVSDASAISAETRVIVEVACVDDLPEDDPAATVEAEEGEPTVVDLAPGTQAVVVTIVTPPEVGTVEVAGSSVTYTPMPGECGTDTFTYMLTAPDGTTVTRATVLEVPCEASLAPGVLRVLGGPVAVSGSVTGDVEAATARSTQRLAGPDRYATSVETAREAWPTGADTVFIATGENFPDGLAAGAAAAAYDAPMVLTPRDQLPDVTRDLLVDLAPQRVVVLGGESAVSADVAAAIAAATGVTPERLGGGDRYETASLVAAAAWPDGSDVVYLATGTTFPDALAGAAAASIHGAPVLLARPDALPDGTTRALLDLAPERIVVLGGEQALSAAIVDDISHLTGITPERLAGADRYATASAIARDAWPGGSRSAYLATGEDFPDALSGAAAAGRRQVPVLLVRPTALPPATLATLQRLLE